MEDFVAKITQKIDSKLLWITLLLLIVGYQVYYVFFGLDFQDGFYHINRMVSDNPYVMTFLSYKLGYFWSVLVGKSVLSFRLFNAMLYSVMLLVPAVLVKEKKQFVLIAFMISFPFALLNWNLIGYDTFSFLFLILATVGVLNYFNTPSNFSLFVLILLSVLAISVRLPNILCVPIIGLFILIYGKWYRQKWYWLPVFWYGFSTMISFVIVLSITYGSPSGYWAQIQNSLHATQEDHSLSALLTVYIKHFFWIVKILFFLGSFYFLYGFLKKKRFGLGFFFLLSIFPVYLYSKKIFSTGFNTKAALFLASMLILFLVLEAFFHVKMKSEKKELLPLITILALLFLPCLGSNSGFKYAGIFIVFFPWLYLRSKLWYKEYFILVFIFLIPLSILEKRNIKFMDESQPFLTSAYDVKNLEGIRSTPERVVYVDQVVKDCNYLSGQKKKIILYGLNSHIFNYLVNHSVSNFDSFAMKLDNQEEIIKMQHILEKERICVIITAPDLEENKLSSMEKMITTHHYARFYKKGYVILIPKEQVDVWKIN